MFEFDEINQKISEFKKKLCNLESAIKPDELKKQIDELENLTASPDFWNDSSHSKKIFSKLSALKSKFNSFSTLKNDLEEMKIMSEMANAESDSQAMQDVERDLRAFEKELQSQTISTLFSGEYDSNNAILTLHAGAGGTEAQDWVEMLCRMYIKFSEKHNFKTKMLDFLDGEEAGLKSASILVEGTNAYGFLKSEAGVHRLVRVSPFDSAGRRHTSFASVEVMPEIDDEIKIEISPDDVKMDVFRASGAGGQHINKTSSAVRLTHIPSGIVVACQNERSQVQNRETAMKMLKSKLLEIKEREHLEKIEDIRGVKENIEWGSQIRSYVFMPYTLVKDHRSKYEVGNINAVMDGDLDGFIMAYLKGLPDA